MYLALACIGIFVILVLAGLVCLPTSSTNIFGRLSASVSGRALLLSPLICDGVMGIIFLRCLSRRIKKNRWTEEELDPARKVMGHSAWTWVIFILIASAMVMIVFRRSPALAATFLISGAQGLIALVHILRPKVAATRSILGLESQD